MGFRTKLDFSDNRQVKQRIETTTVLSGATAFGVPYDQLPSGPNYALSAITLTIPPSSATTGTFSGNNTTTVFTWPINDLYLADSTFSAITPSNSASSQTSSFVFTADTNTMFTVDGNVGYGSYTGVGFTMFATSMVDLGSGSYSGTVNFTNVNYVQAPGLDFSGRTIWADVSGITRTDRLIISNNPQVGYVWTCLDSEGMGGWTSVSGSSSGSTIWTAGTGTNSAVLGGSGGIASGAYSVAAGLGVSATTNYTFAEGFYTLASGSRSHAEGSQTQALGGSSHAEGVSTIASGTSAHAEGRDTIAGGTSSHAEGYGTVASGNYSHAEGFSDSMGTTTASGEASHAEGKGSVASGDTSHAEGWITIAGGDASHAEGFQTKALGDYSHSEGQNTIASGFYSHAEGTNTVADGDAAHAEGYQTTAFGQGSHAEGGYFDGFTTFSGGTTYSNASHAEGVKTIAGWNGFTISYVSAGEIVISSGIDYSDAFQGSNVVLNGIIYPYSSINYTAPNFTIYIYDTTVNFYGGVVADLDQLNHISADTMVGLYSHAEGLETKAFGDASHAEGKNTIAGGEASHAQGSGSIASGQYSHAEGEETTASGKASHAKGFQTTASGDYSHSEGNSTTASGDYSHAEGATTIASGLASHAEGSTTIAEGDYSHAEGYKSFASGDFSHAEGGGYDGITGGTASNLAAHAEGQRTLASGIASHAQGDATIASGDYSHSEGSFTIASGNTAHAEGSNTIAGGEASHAEGYETQAMSDYSHAEGYQTQTYGRYTHVGGYNSIINVSGGTTTSDNSFAHSKDSTIESSANSIILGGINHNITSSNKSAIVGGEHNEVIVNVDELTQPEFSGIFVGKDNKIIPREGSSSIDMSASYCAIVGGELNTISGHSHSFIGGGISNLIACDAKYNAIIAGQYNTNHAANGVIIGGEHNMLGFDTSCPSAADNSIILGGQYNIISLSSNNTHNTAIIGGDSNIIDNTLGDIYNTVIIGGSSITATTSNTVYVPDLVITGLTSTDPIATNSSGKIVAGTSDARLKQNINKLSNSLDIVKNLRGVSFEYTPESEMGGGVRYGFIAQEVQQYIPDIVRSRAKGDGMLSLNYNEIVPILVEAVKELSSGITISNNSHLETQTILAEDNNVELNFNGTQQTAIGGGLSVLHAKGQDQAANLITDTDGNFVTNNDFKPQALTIPIYTPTSSNDTAGSEGNITRDDNYMYIKTSTGWKRTNLESF